MDLKGQGAIEYLLIIAAAILVVALVIIAVTGALSGGQEQEEVALSEYIKNMDKLEETFLVAQGSLSLREESPTGKLTYSPITRADKTPIESQANLNEAYANGELNIYDTGEELSILQKPNSYHTELNLNKCHCINDPTHTNCRFIDLTDINQKFVEITSVNNMPQYARLLNTKHKVFYQEQNMFLLFDQKITDEICNTSNETQGWKLKVWDYNLIYGPGINSREIGIAPQTGTITSPSLNFTKIITDGCETSGKFCYVSLPSDGIFNYCKEYPNNCVGECNSKGELPSEIGCNLPECIEKKENGASYCTHNPYIITTLSVDYFHYNN